MRPAEVTPYLAVLPPLFGAPGEEAVAPAPISDPHFVGAVAEEARAAGLRDVIFVTRDGIALAESKLRGGIRLRQVLLPRGGFGRGLEGALRAARLAAGTAPLVLLQPDRLPRRGKGSAALLVSAYRRRGGNLVLVTDDKVLRRDGTFAAVAQAAAGGYLLQPEVLERLQAEPAAGLAGALLDLAEAWPVTAVPLSRGQTADDATPATSPSNDTGDDAVLGVAD